MLKQTTIWPHDGQMRKLAEVGKSQGLTTASLVRIAILEYLRRESQKQAAEK